MTPDKAEDVQGNIRRTMKGGGIRQKSCAMLGDVDVAGRVRTLRALSRSPRSS